MSTTKVSLCPACGACPAVEVSGGEIRIGEEGNLVKLNRDAWNALVQKVKSGELKEL